MLAAEAAGIDIATLPCVASRVDPFPHLAFEAMAFNALSTDRPLGLERGPIPWRSIYFYGERYGLDVDEFDRLVAIVRAMDDAYLAYFKKPESS